LVTKYPTAVDGNSELPLTTNNVTQVKAEVINNLRGAIVAIERELGIIPSGAYGTVRARLDALVLGTPAPGTSSDATQESFSVSDNQTSFTLSDTPLKTSTIMMFVNGIKQQYGTDYTASDTTVTWLDSFTLQSTDIVEFWYLI
jgi:hypothetical protein